MPPKNTPATTVKTVEQEGESAVLDASEKPTHRIVGHGQNGFWRAGKHWPVEGLDVVRDDFDDEQWAALEAEPKLSIKTL